MNNTGCDKSVTNSYFIFLLCLDLRADPPENCHLAVKKLPKT